VEDVQMMEGTRFFVLRKRRFRAAPLVNLPYGVRRPIPISGTGRLIGIGLHIPGR
jgi:hypothetical protein